MNQSNNNNFFNKLKIEINNYISKEPISDMSQDELVELINKVKKDDNITIQENKSPILKTIKFLLILIIGLVSIEPVSNIISQYFQDKKNKETIINLNKVAEKMYFNEYAPGIALKIIDKSLNINDQYAQTIYLESFIRSMEVVEELKNLDRPYNYDELQKAKLALANAEFILESKEKEYYPNAFLIKAQTYYALNEIDNALHFIDEAINQDPQTFYKIRKSTILIESGNEKKNINEIKLGLNILNNLEKETHKDNLKWIFMYKAIALTYQMELENINLEKEIEHYYQKAFQIDQKFHLALFNYAKYLQEVSNKENRLEESVKFYKLVLNILPDNKEVYYQLAKLYGYTDKYEKASVYLDKALKVDKNYFSANFLKSKVLYEQKNFKEALEYLNNAIRINPNDFQIFLSRGEIFILLEDFFNAEKDFFEIIDNIEVINIETENILIDANIYLSDMYISQNKFDKAIERLTEIEKYNVYNYSEYYKVKFRYFKGKNNKEKALENINLAINYSRDNKTKNILEKIEFLIEINECTNANNDLILIDKQKEHFELRNKIEEIELSIKKCLAF